MTDFYTLWTDNGLTKFGDATLAIPFDVTTAVVGDGNGAEVIPNKGQPDLVNQVWSGAIGSKVRSKDDPNTIVFEFAIPAGDGPFTIREVGLKSADGQLCFVGNFPVTEKPVAADGSVRDMVLRLPVHFENADVVNLVVDPAVVLATKAEMAAHVLLHLDPTSEDEEKTKHLSDAQAKNWEDHIKNSAKHLTAEQIKQIIVDSRVGINVNLDYVPSEQEKIDRKMLERNGDQLLIADFPELFAKIGRQFTPPGVAAEYFCLMDDRGLFDRTWDHGAGVDPDAATRADRGDGIGGDNVGTIQDDQFRNHNHSIIAGVPDGAGPWGLVRNNQSGGNGIVNANGGQETRPKSRNKWGGIFY